MLNLIFKYRQKKWVNIFVIYLRYLIGGAFVFSAIPKITGHRFTTANGETAPIDTWVHFFETLYRSGIYWDFLGWLQILAGLVLMTQRFATIGALLFLSIIINVFVITVSYHMTGTIVITGLMLLATVFLVLWDYHKVSVLFTQESRNEIRVTGLYHEWYQNDFWAWLGFILFLITVIYVLCLDRNPMLWFLICVSIGLIGYIYFNFRKMKS